ncbi:MAG: ROK family protein [Betaproteobacteria bacterium]|nr:ROK family protein [Betaproteobacteria bacterium]
MLRIGVDLGGSKIEIAALDEHRQIRHRRRVATPAGDYEATLAMIAALVREAGRELGEQASVGVAMPGALSPETGILRNSNSTCLNGRPFRQDLERVLGSPVRVANDANCFALSEAVDGAAAGAGVVFGVILGTGVGGGVVVNRNVLTGANAIAGEWGHNPLPAMSDGERPGPACYCGRRGCIETFLSGPGLTEDHRRANGIEISAREIAADAARGDAACEATLARYEERLARSLAGVINLLDPDVIVLGGGLSNVERQYRSVPALWRRHVFSDVVRTRLTKNVHGDSSGVRGAAWLWQSPLSADSAS